MEDQKQHTGMITGNILERRRPIRDPAGDHDGYHRRQDRKHWRYELVEPVTIEDTRPFDILLTRSKGFISPIIIFFELVDGKVASFSHSGQILPGYIVSEANYPYYERTPLQDYLTAQKQGKTRLTIIRIKPEMFGSLEMQREAEAHCLSYHNKIALVSGVGRQSLHHPAPNRGDIRRVIAYQTGHPYDAIGGLFPMALMSIVRNLLPFIKKGRWENIPEINQQVIFICSGIINWGWAWFMRESGICLFPASMSKLVPSPQDLWASAHTRYVSGFKKIYQEPVHRRDTIGFGLQHFIS